MKPTDALPHPEEWATGTVGDLVEIRRGVSWSKDQEHDELQPGTTPVVRIGNVQDRLDLHDLLYLSGLRPSVMERKRVAEGWSLMVGSNGNRNRVGNAVLIKEDMSLLFASFLLGVRPKAGSRLLPEYFYRWLTTPEVQAYLSASSEGSTGLNNLSHSFFKAMTIPFPPDQVEQRSIVEVLDAVDLIFDRTADEERRSEDLKLALLQDLLRKGTRAEVTRDTPLGSLPGSWEVVPVSAAVTEFQYGLSVAMQQKGELAILRMGNIQAGDVVLDDLKYVSLPERITASYLIKRGDLLFNRTNSQEHVGKVGIYRQDRPATFASYLIRLHYNPDMVDGYYLGQLLGSYPAQCRIKRFATPGVQQVNINATNLGRVLIQVPMGPTGLDEQREIAAILEQADAKTRSYRTIREALLSLKRSLTHDLTTGSVRVSYESKVVAEI